MPGLTKQDNITGVEIAVIGMSGRFPGAGNIDEFWENLKNGVEAVTFLSDGQLSEAGVDPRFLDNPNYIKSIGGVLENKEYFDAHFFDYTPIEAEMMEPQMRIFHECAWEALENSALYGYDPCLYDCAVGVYAGASSSFYWEALNFLSGKREEITHLAANNIANKDFLCTRLAYKFDLKGPAITVQTACSTSLVAIHLACQAILDGECKMALAGGVSISSNNASGYLYQEGMIASADGHCRAFDIRATGTIGGEGAGVVVLKLLENAIEDRDYIHAVIKGTAINNDGIKKASFTAPSREAHTETVRAAFRVAEVEPESISYIEAHGTGTPLGDPIEIEALKEGFNTSKKRFCAVGSVKTNIGHLDAAAGVAGFLKAVLALKHKLIPPSLNFEKPNPKIDFENSPFYINTRLREWKNDKYPLRAGVSSLGIGGTNAHVILEEALPEFQGTTEGFGGREYKLLLLSARTESALHKAAENLKAYLKNNPRINLADVSYTLQVGRRAFLHRQMMVCSTVNEAAGALSSPGLGKIREFVIQKEDRPVVFMFSGQGSQYVGMGLDLYRTEPVFRTEMDRCFGILNRLMARDVKEILYPAAVGNRGDETGQLNQTEITQPVIFAVEYALAKLLLQWGISPYAMIGHSIGEYTAACLAGVLSLEDALKVVVLKRKADAGDPRRGNVECSASRS